MNELRPHNLNSWLRQKFSTRRLNDQEFELIEGALREVLSDEQVLGHAVARYVRGHYRDMNKDELLVLLNAFASLCAPTSNVRYEMSRLFANIISSEARPATSVPEIRGSSIEDCQLVCISGFHYSGASALFDFLSEHHSCIDLLPEDHASASPELSIVNSLAAECSVEKWPVSTRAILMQCLRFVFDAFVLATDRSSEKAATRKSMYLRVRNGDEGKLARYVDAYRVFAANILEASAEDQRGRCMHRHASAQREVGSYINELARIFGKETGGSRKLIIDNTPPARHANRLSAFPVGTKVLFVERDFFDQLATIRSRGYFDKGYYKDLTDFAWSRRKERQTVLDFMERFGRIYDIAFVTFEDFVEDRSVRRGVCQWLEIPYQESGRKFDSLESRKNIGIYCDEHSMPGDAIIKQEFPELVSERLCETAECMHMRITGA